MKINENFYVVKEGNKHLGCSIFGHKLKKINGIREVLTHKAYNQAIVLLYEVNAKECKKCGARGYSHEPIASAVVSKDERELIVDMFKHNRRIQKGEQE